MKNSILLATLVLLFASCNKTCDSFHTGSDCTTEVRTAYYGIYTGTVTYPGGASNESYIVQQNGTNPKAITVQGINATLSNAETFTVDAQTASFGGTIVVITAPATPSTITAHTIALNFIANGDSYTFTGSK